jgi:phosphoribosylglycinamide formyltransferase-1
VLISGGGTTLQNLIDRIGDGTLHAHIVQVISSKAEVRGNQRALDAGIPLEVIARKSFPSTEAFSERLFESIRRSGAELVCLAGFLQLLRIPSDFTRRVINIHPSLLPAFGGKGMYGHHVHEAVLKSGAKESGCTVHFVDDLYDHGEIILQNRVAVLANDTPETLAARVFEQECLAYVEAIGLIGNRESGIGNR